MKNIYNLEVSHFKNNIADLLERSKRALVLLRIPYSSNKGDFFFLEDEDDITNLISNSKSGYSLTIFKSIDVLNSGIITEKFIQTTLKIASKHTFDPELMVVFDSYKDYQRKRGADLEFAENIDELQEILTENLGKKITLIVEPMYFNEENEFHLYIANSDGTPSQKNTY
ncbi:hypothetical protein [Kordia sp.]|uniref:hypothetical protein n=1 Tax=Kordia sp. TaxID=1965332 RepID=UPI003B5A729F